MTMLATENPFPQYFDTDGSPLDNGMLYFGAANQNPETSPITVYWDSAGTQPAAQPIKTLNGYTIRNGTPALVFVGSNYSLLVRDSRGRVIYFAKDSAEFSNDQYLQDQINASSGNIAAVYAALANTDDASKGDKLIGVKLVAAGGVARTQHDKNADVVNVRDFGVSTSNTAAQNSAALNLCLEYCVSNGFEELYLDEDYNFDATVRATLRSQVSFVGPGTVANLYRKGVASSIYAPFVPPNDVNPVQHLKALQRTQAPVAVIMGDSISTEGPDTYANTVNMWSVIKQRLQTCNPDKTFTFHNRAIGGKTWVDANGTPTGGLPAWYTIPSNTWLSYVQSLNPDVVFLAFGMNDANGFNAGAVDAVVQKILLWSKVPDIVFITNPVPALTTLYPDGAGFGFVEPVFQEGRDYAAGWVRTYAKSKGYGLIDINRMFVAARDGYDPVASIMRRIETVAGGSYTASVPSQDFAFAGMATGAAWSEGRSLKVKCGLGPVDFIFVTKTAGNFVVSGFTTTIGTYKTIATGVPVPATAFYLEVSLYGDIARVLIDTSGGLGKTVIAEFQIIAHGGQHAPQVEWQDASGTGPFTSITYVAGFGDLKYPQVVSDADVWGISDLTADIKAPFGGNGINHYTSKGIELVVRPVVEATNLGSVRPWLDEIDLTLGTNTTALTTFAKAEKVGRLVRLTGTIRNTATTPGNGDTIFTVPVGFRPRRDGIRFGSAGGPLFQHVGAGVFKCEVGPINTLYALDNISYFID